MAASGATANLATFGILFSFGLFLTPLGQEFDAPTAAVASVFSGSVFFYYVGGAIGGMVGDRRGARLVLGFGAVALPVGLVAASLATELWQVVALYVPLVGLAVGSGYAPLIGAVGRALPEQRAVAIALVLTGVGAGTLVMPLVIRALLDRGDWRATFRILAVAAALALATAALLAIDRGRDGSAPSTIIRAMARSRRFRRLYLSVILVAPGFYAPLAFLNDYAVDQGIDLGRAAVLVGSVGLGSVVSRLGFGALAPRMGPVRQYRVSHVLFVVALGLWLVSGDAFAMLLAAAVLHGLGWAAWVTAAPLVLADWFGLDDLGLAVGGFYTGLGLGALVGPPVSGAVIDAFGHRPALVLVVVTTIASLAVVAGGGLSEEVVESQTQ